MLKTRLFADSTQNTTIIDSGVTDAELVAQALADALVSLHIFLARHSSDKRQTVQGPVDVAALPKGGGFQWVKRKSLGSGRGLAAL